MINVATGQYMFSVSKIRYGDLTDCCMC